ncbi:uncharacterized protein LOC135711048 [Ochlerotatus camptorhynchus]|uniref:uncharacterized protein LOC135711048 n=1 Tax=Ochlerotatus camptorhynchus TaxID=644619 RepID=UPI0031D733A5
MKRRLKYFDILAFLMLVDVRSAVGEMPSFRILAPEFICGQPKPENTSDTGSAVPQQITIGLQTKGGQKLHYSVTVQFSLLNGFVSQRHTLNLWESIRKLEKRLQKERETISDGNQISILNEELVSGVIYTFQVVGIDRNGTASQEQNFTLTYRGKSLQATVVQDGSSSTGDVSLLLLGSEVSYPDVPFTVTAKVIFCKAKNNYKFKWTVSGPEDAPLALNTNSDVLEIPAGTLSPTESYEIGITVVDSSEEKQIVAANMKLNVLTRALKGNVLPSDASTGFAQTTEVRTIFNDRSVSSLVWSCEDTSGDTRCSEDLIISERTASISFIKESNYTISATVGDVNLISNLQVNAKSTISVVLQTLPPMYLIPGQRYEILVDVHGLVPKCISNWTVVKGEGYSYFDTAAMGGLGGVFINDIEENFLSELVDYGNDTVTREVTLILPANAPNWEGLAPDVLYKFRLVTNCPEPIDDSVDSKVSRGTVISHWDMILETNAPPKGLPLEVTPNENGTALSTFFTFATGVAQERESDFPLLYSYWYSAEGNSINFANYYEVMSAETQLPYSKDGISTFYEVCDSRSACSRVDGPKITLKANPSLTPANTEFRIDAVENNFLRGNLREATKTAFDTLITLKNQDAKNFNDVYSKMMALLEDQTPIVRKVFVERSRYLPESSILQFVQQVKILIDLGQKGSNDNLLGELLELIDSVERGPARKTRATEPNLKTTLIGKAETKLELFESLINSPNGTEESKNSNKAKLLYYIPTAVRELCDNDKKYAYSSDLFTMEVMKVSSKVIKPLQTGIRIPDNETSLQHAVLKSTDEPKIDNLPAKVPYYCLGKVWYRTDLLTSYPMLGMYQVFLLMDGSEKLAEWKDGQYLWNISLPVGNSAEGYKCELWSKEQRWANNLCESSPHIGFLECNCSQLNYLRIVSSMGNDTETNVTISTTTVASVATETSSIADQPTEITTSTDMLTFASLSTDVTPVTSPASTTLSSPVTVPMTTVSSTTTPSSTMTTPSSTITTTTTSSPNATQPSQPTTITNTSTKPVDAISNPNTTLQEAEQLKANATRGHLGGGGTGPLGYSMIGALFFFAILTVVALILYRRRRHTTSLAEELHGIASRVRTQSLPVRYARFQDEHNMSGDNVSTISDTVTI